MVIGASSVHDTKADSALAFALGKDTKGRFSVVILLAAIPLAFVSRWLSCALYVLVTVIWLVPDRRIERLAIS